MKQITLAFLVLSCSAPLTEPDTASCASELTSDEKSADPLSFGRYGGGYGRDSGELWDALACATTRWKAATCLDVDLSIEPEGWARWLSNELMPLMGNGPHHATGNVSGPFDDARIKINASSDPAYTCPVMIHEMGHILRRSYGHPGPDGSMSFPSVHVFSEPISRITQEDIDGVCDTLDCECEIPE